MTVTKDQAQMLATLAVACRPYRAPTWDHAGVMDMISRVKDRSLPEVCLAVIRAAADREAITPGVIPSNGTHWQEQLKPAKWQPDTSPMCRTCGKTRPGCEGTPRFQDDDHEFEPTKTGSTTDVSRTVAALRELTKTEGTSDD